ncbi:MAG: hypothetical protein OXQ31_13190, partial [Spirochaetaceae bacterium]|nr:hypothetical protein [Spirochaetaceae bacterium]
MAVPKLSKKPKRDRAAYMRAYRARKRAQGVATAPKVKRPTRLIPWIESLTVTQGEGAGGSLRLFPWERDWIDGLETDRRRTNGLSIARGAGKTTLVSALAAAAVAGPWAQSRGLVLIVASTFKQARVAFGHVLSFMQPVIAENAERWRVLDSSQAALIPAYSRRSGEKVGASAD